MKSVRIFDDDQGVHVTDAKALFDLLNRRSGNAGQCRRAQIDVAVICISARTLQVVTFWVPGSVMLADPLTKRLGNSALLRKAMREATYALTKHGADGKEDDGKTCDMELPPEGCKTTCQMPMSHLQVSHP